jgi:hypothetical protein
MLHFLCCLAAAQAALRGELRQLGAGSLTVEAAGGVVHTRALRDCLSLQFVRPDVKDGSDGAPGVNDARAELDGGDWLLAPVGAGSGDQLAFQLAGAPFVVHVDALRKLVFPARLPRSFVDTAPAANTDRLYKRNTGPNGESIVEPVNGTLIAFREKGIEFEGVFGKDVFPLDRVVQLTISPIGSKPAAKAVETDAVLALVPDGRLAIKLDTVAEGFVRGESPRLGPVAVPVRAIRSIRFRGDRYRVLSELEPVEVNETPYFGGDAAPRFPWRRDRSVMGGPLRAGGSSFESGFGVHAQSLLTFELDGTHAAFRSRVGLDDSTLDLPRRGSVVFRVLGDGKPLWESPVVRTGDRVLDTPELDLRGVKRLTLAVDYADGFDVADRADWCEPILMREPPASPPASSPSSAPAAAR